MSVSTSSLVERVYATIQNVLEGILDQGVLYPYDNEENEITEVYRKDSTVLYHMGPLVSYKHKEWLIYDFAMVRPIEDEDETKVNITFYLVKYFNVRHLEYGIHLTSVMRSIANYSLKALQKELSVKLQETELEDENMITRAHVKTKFATIELPEDVKNSINFIATDCNDDQNCLQVEVEMTLLN